jgi:hypothetical protein
MRNTPLIYGALLATLSTAAHAASLPDSGQLLCDNGANVMAACSNDNTGDASTMPRQDGRFGRDPANAAAEVTKVGAGKAGFDYTKVANDGSSLAASATLGSGATDWACTQDNLTGLMWEVKTADGGVRDTGWNYTWYSDATRGDGTSNELNAGDAGTENGGVCFNKYDATTNPTGDWCDTAGYVAAINAASLCGFSDWRLPAKRELETLTHLGVQNPAIDGDYFPNTAAAFIDCYWVSATNTAVPANAWNTKFNIGSTQNYGKNNPFRVRLVRGPIY